ncbi:MAG: hypothetical protein EZS28_056629, partial [Streblomastix strix]
VDLTLTPQPTSSQSQRSDLIQSSQHSHSDSQLSDSFLCLSLGVLTGFILYRVYVALDLQLDLEDEVSLQRCYDYAFESAGRVAELYC